MLFFAIALALEYSPCHALQKQRNFFVEPLKYGAVSAWKGVLTPSLSLLAGAQADPEAGEHHSPEEGEPLVGETYQAGEAPTVFGP